MTQPVMTPVHDATGMSPRHRVAIGCTALRLPDPAKVLCVVDGP